MRWRAEWIVLHCSDSTWGDVAVIRGWHTSPPRNWRDVGYHYVITNGREGYKARHRDAKDGIVQRGRPLDDDAWIEAMEVGAHALGLNRVSVGVCLVGRPGRFTFLQYRSALAVCSRLCGQFHLSTDRVIGHYETPGGRAQGKTCPGIPMGDFRDELALRLMPG